MYHKKIFRLLVYLDMYIKGSQCMCLTLQETKHFYSITAITDVKNFIKITLPKSSFKLQLLQFTDAVNQITITLLMIYLKSINYIFVI